MVLEKSGNPKNLDHPSLPKHPGKLNDSRCNSFEYRGRCPSSPSPSHSSTPPEGGMYSHWRRDPKPPHYCTHEQELEKSGKENHGINLKCKN
ncbi:hypothetical protein AVEN_1090-1 [Araneus ventricosus]|uniref:Uncharacterized protein n=1 Tax=Araneus ventricosus TaxID=182803 RepID=A0A4Y2N9J1_ARAVE|nr:hypothetical protein AVEN_1090-1 [Araneus ventricosus]